MEYGTYMVYWLLKDPMVDYDKKYPNECFIVGPFHLFYKKFMLSKTILRENDVVETLCLPIIIFCQLQFLQDWQ